MNMQYLPHIVTRESQNNVLWFRLESVNRIGNNKHGHSIEEGSSLHKDICNAENLRAKVS